MALNGSKWLIFANQLDFGEAHFSLLFLLSRTQFSYQQWRQYCSTVGLHAWPPLYEVAEVHQFFLCVDQLPKQ